MDDDKTVIMSPIESADNTKQLDILTNNCLEISILGENNKQIDSFLFKNSFTIGRAKDNEICIPDVEVSRYHIKITRVRDIWYVRDLNSTNGSLINDKIVETGKLIIPCKLQLGESQARIFIKDHNSVTDEKTQLSLSHYDDLTQIVSDKSSTIDSDNLPSKEEIYRRYLSEDHNNAGEYTQIVRDVIKSDNKQKLRKYNLLIIGIVALLIGTIGLLSYQYFKIKNSKELAINIFYDMKKLEVDLAVTEIELKRNKNSALLLAIDKKRKTLKAMREHYEEYIEELGILDASKISTNKTDWLILMVAKSFGELDIDLPKEFVKETKKYIRYWQGSPRMRRAIKVMYQNGYDKIILDALKKEGLPPQFLYLAMQESNFNERAIGPRTRWGIAKGAWQFIPSTATNYGLKLGPLVESLSYDPDDERHNFKKSTEAAAKYLKYIYGTEAQASGLLVMASYNWGEHRVERIISQMPDNPRKRNFWELIQAHKIPDETYHYVFYIFSAAVIAEDPSFFGFKFTSPTASMN